MYSVRKKKEYVNIQTTETAKLCDNMHVVIVTICMQLLWQYACCYCDNMHAVIVTICMLLFVYDYLTTTSSDKFTRNPETDVSRLGNIEKDFIATIYIVLFVAGSIIKPHYTVLPVVLGLTLCRQVIIVTMSIQSFVHCNTPLPYHTIIIPYHCHAHYY